MNPSVRIGGVGIDADDGSWLGFVLCIAAARSDSR
jgi:hypothetical protein